MGIHFAQAEGSPPTERMLVKYLGKYGEKGLKGLGDFLETDLSQHIPETIEMLQRMTADRLSEIDAVITLLDFSESNKNVEGKNKYIPIGETFGYVPRFDSTGRRRP